MTANPLLVAQDSPGSLAGTGFLESVSAFCQDVAGDGDKANLVVDLPVMALDGLSVLLNPLGELVKAGVGWLMEHLAFLREPLEMVTGDAAAVTAIAASWDKIAGQLDEAAAQYRSALGTVSSWDGEAACAYRRAADPVQGGLAGLAQQAHNTSTAVATAACAVAAERAVIFDLISSFISRVITEALIAAATSVASLGGSVAAFITSVTLDASLLAAKLGKRLAKLVTAMQKFVTQTRVLGDHSKDVARRLGRLAHDMHRGANATIDTTTVLKNTELAPVSRLGQAITGYGDWAEARPEWMKRIADDSVAPKDMAKTARDNVDKAAENDEAPAPAGPPSGGGG